MPPTINNTNFSSLASTALLAESNCDDTTKLGAQCSHFNREGYVGFSTEVRMSPKPLSHAQVRLKPTYAIYRGSTIELFGDKMCDVSLYTALYSFSTATMLAQ